MERMQFHPQRSCVTALLCHGCQDVGRPGAHGPTLDSASPLPLENLKLVRCYICLFGPVSHESIVCHMLFFFLVEADVMSYFPSFEMI